MSIKLSIIIPTFKRDYCVRNVLNSLVKQNFSDFEVIIIDESPDYSVFRIFEIYNQKKCFKSIRFYKNTKKGQGAARNLGAVKSRSKILYFVDSDVVLEKNAVKEHYLLQKRYDIVLGKIIFPDVPVSFYNRQTDLAFFFYQIKGPYLDYIRFLTCNLSIKKIFFMENKGFDQDFSGYGFEDIELGYRICQDNIKIYYGEKAVGRHYNNRNINSILARTEKIVMASWKFYMKHPEVYNKYLIPGQRVKSIQMNELPDLKPNTFHQYIYFHEENLHIKMLENKVKTTCIVNVKRIFERNRLNYNIVSLLEICLLLENYRVHIPILSDNILNRFLVRYKLRILFFKTSFRIGAQNKKREIYYYSGMCKKNVQTWDIFNCFLNIFINRKEIYYIILSRIRKIINSLL